MRGNLPPPALLGPASTGFEVQRAFAALGPWWLALRATPCFLNEIGAWRRYCVRKQLSNLKQTPFFPTQRAKRVAVGGRAKQRPVGLQNPLRLGRGAQGAADKGWRMSERSELCQTPLTPSTAGCPVAQRRGPRLRVAFLLGTFLWRSKEEVPRQPGRVPAPALSKTPIPKNQPTAHTARHNFTADQPPTTSPPSPANLPAAAQTPPAPSPVFAHPYTASC